MVKLYLIIVGISGFLSVALGAFAAHGLKGKIADNLLAAFQTATHYQMFHTLALFGLCLALLQLASPSRALFVGAFCWIAGMILFSGSLYWLAVGGPFWLGPVTPLGGLLLMAGWLCLIVGFFTGDVSLRV